MIRPDPTWDPRYLNTILRNLWLSSQNEIIEKVNRTTAHINNNNGDSTESFTMPDKSIIDAAHEQESSKPTMEYLRSALRTPWIADHRQLANNLTQNTSFVNQFNDASPILTDYWMVLLIVLYAIIILGGIFGNASLIVTLYTQSSARLRNPLLVALCMADLMVTGVSAPITVITLILIAQKTFWSTTLICRVICFLQSVPVAASTISLLMLSLDRFATVQHPRLAQLRQRRSLPIVLAFIAWISAILLSTPLLISTTNHHITTFDPITQNQSQPQINGMGVQSTAALRTEINTNDRYIGSTTVSPSLASDNGPETICLPNFGSAQIPSLFVIIYVIFTFLLPGIGVVLNHIGVHQKLCALSLTARAQFNELPLPMPILRRPTHMIIVTGMANAAADDEDSDETHQQRDERRQMMNSKQLKPTPRTPRSLRYGHSIRSHSHIGKNTAPSELPLSQTSTLRSRRRLANMLVAGSFMFIFCWTPYILCLLCSKSSSNDIHSMHFLKYSLLLGYAHSVFNPILHWALNSNSLRQSSFLTRLSSAQRFLRVHFHERNHHPPPSSTNEAALGPFNPRYIKARPKRHAPQNSSHALY